MEKIVKILGIIGSIGYSIRVVLYTYIFIDKIVFDLYILSITSEGYSTKFSFNNMNNSDLYIAILMIAFILLSIALCILLYIRILNKRHLCKSRAIVLIILLILSNTIFIIIPPQSYIISTYTLLRFSVLPNLVWIIGYLRYVSIAFIVLNIIFNMTVNVNAN